MSKVVRCDEVILDLARRGLAEKLFAGRLKARYGDSGRVVGFLDPAAVERFGAAMERVSDKDLVEQGLLLLARTVRDAPGSSTGLLYFDSDEA